MGGRDSETLLGVCRRPWSWIRTASCWQIRKSGWRTGSPLSECTYPQVWVRSLNTQLCFSLGCCSPPSGPAPCANSSPKGVRAHPKCPTSADQVPPPFGPIRERLAERLGRLSDLLQCKPPVQARVGGSGARSANLGQAHQAAAGSPAAHPGEARPEPATGGAAPGEPRDSAAVVREPGGAAGSGLPVPRAADLSPQTGEKQSLNLGNLVSSVAAQRLVLDTLPGRE